MGRSDIDYLDWVVSAVTGCTRISAGCDNCYAQDYLKRFKKPMGVTLHPERLEKEMAKLARIKTPQVVGMCFTGDLFHKDVPFEFIRQVFESMDQVRQHTYLLLTKRPDRMVEFYEEEADSRGGYLVDDHIWPGVSIEDQPTADDRIPKLLSVLAAYHWVSYEPALGPVDIRDILDGSPTRDSEGMTWYQTQPPDWVVCGGESGPKARPSHPDWFRKVRDDCIAAGVPFMFKQWGEWFPNPYADWTSKQQQVVGDISMWRHKRLAKECGHDEHRRLDGEVWDQTPWGKK
jgi:protein gp37